MRAALFWIKYICIHCGILFFLIVSASALATEPKEQTPSKLESAAEPNVKISALEKENNLLRIQLSILYSRLQGYKKELASQVKKLSIEETDITKKTAHHNLAYLYAQKGDWDEAIKEYQKALRYSAVDKDIYYNLGCLYVWKKKFKEAVKEFERVLSLDPNDLETYYNLADIYNKNLKDTKKAEMYYQKFLENDSKKK